MLKNQVYAIKHIFKICFFSIYILLLHCFSEATCPRMPVAYAAGQFIESSAAQHALKIINKHQIYHENDYEYTQKHPPPSYSHSSRFCFLIVYRRRRSLLRALSMPKENRIPLSVPM